MAGVTASGIDAAKAVLGFDKLNLPEFRARDLLTGKGEGMRLWLAEEVTDLEMDKWIRTDEELIEGEV